MKKIDELEKAQFCEQLEMILNGGLSVEEGLQAVIPQIKDVEYVNALKKILSDMEKGSSLSKALSTSGMYDSYFVHMVEVGETSGYLDKVFHELSLYYHRMYDTQEKVQNALTYPGILIMMMLAVIIVMLWKILPLFQSVLSSMGLQMSGTSLFLFETGKCFALISLVILVIAFGICLYIYISIRVSHTSFTKVLQKFIFTKSLAYDLSVVQFAYALSLLLNSGYRQEEALDMCSSMCEDIRVKEKIDAVSSGLKQGLSMKECLVEEKIFKETYNRILIIGLKSGHFETAMQQIAVAYEKDIDYSIQKLLNIIEPTLVILLSCIAGMILLAVMLPLSGIMAGL